MTWEQLLDRPEFRYLYVNDVLFKDAIDTHRATGAPLVLCLAEAFKAAAFWIRVYQKRDVDRLLREPVGYVGGQKECDRQGDQRPGVIESPMQHLQAMNDLNNKTLAKLVAAQATDADEPVVRGGG